MSTLAGTARKALGTINTTELDDWSFGGGVATMLPVSTAEVPR